MKTHLLTPLAGALLFAALFGGCDCSGKKIPKALPVVKLAATSVDFGPVPLSQTERRPLVVSNNGSGLLSLRQFTFGKPALFTGPFGPDGGGLLDVVEVPSGSHVEVAFGYTPARLAASPADADTDTVTASTDDPTTATVSVALSGYGTQASFEVLPARLDFGDVELPNGQAPVAKVLDVTLTNVGSNVAHLTAVHFDGLPDAFGSAPALSTVPGPLQPSSPLTMHVAFTPQDLEPHAGTLTFETDYPPQAQLTVPITGRGTAERYQVCRQHFWDDGGVEDPVCVPDPVTSADGGSSLLLDFGSRDESGPPAQGRVWVRNAGNLPTTIASQILNIPRNNPCGTFASDFHFTSTSPSGVVTDGGFDVTTLPDGGTEVSMHVSYHASHHCAVGGYPDGGPDKDDLTDSATMLVSRVPGNGFRNYQVAFQGRSALPNLRIQGFSVAGGGGSNPVTVENAGERPLSITAISVYDDQHQPCAASSRPVCAQVSFTPDQPLPLSVPAATPAADGGVTYGSLLAGSLTITGAGPLSGSLHLTTNDPRHLEADFNITVH
jgi:hypothetical protein